MTDSATVLPDVPGWLNTDIIPEQLRDEMRRHGDNAPDIDALGRGATFPIRTQSLQ